MVEPHRGPFSLLALLGILALAGCAHIPEGRSVIDDVTVVGAKQLEPADVAGKLATTASPKFLELFQGVVYDYEVFDPNTLQRDLARVERYYRARGYYSVRVRAGRVFRRAKSTCASRWP